MSNINSVLKLGKKLILTTPNIVVFLFRRLKLLLGMWPQYATHVHEYTKREMEELLRRHGFKTLEIYYLEVNDLTLVDAEIEDYLKLRSYRDLLMLISAG